MSRTRFLIVSLSVLAVLSLAAMTVGAQGVTTPTYSAFPDDDPGSGRFVNLTNRLKSLGEQGTHLSIEVPASVTQFDLSIFDADMGGKWDPMPTGVPADQVWYTLYTDLGEPGVVDAGDVMVRRWSSIGMPDDSWFMDTLSNHPSALSGAVYRYNLVVEWQTTPASTTNEQNNFKVRCLGRIYALKGSTYGFIGYGPLDPSPSKYPATSYDGSWHFLLVLPEPATRLILWNGDFDRAVDTDDPNSEPFPPFAYLPGSVTLPEGPSLGDPADDARLGSPLRQPPPIIQTISAPGGAWTREDDNPSGNQEWERFVVGLTNTPGPGDSTFIVPDVIVPALPAGSYDWRILGADGRNTLFIHPEYDLAPPGAIGDFVWHDYNHDGVQDKGEPGIGGVTVELWWDGNGDGTPDTLLRTAVTSPSGYYLFPDLSQGTYEVRVDPTTLPAGFAWTATWDYDGIGTLHKASVALGAGEINLYVDFGYWYTATPPGTGTPGYWKNHPEAWPVNSIVIGGVVYTKDQALNWLGQDDKQDKTITLFRALVCAQLNVIVGNNYGCIVEALAGADAWMAAHRVGSGVRANTQFWKIGEPLYLTLDQYNNGGLCAPHRD